jgi:hypothetical protein
MGLGTIALNCALPNVPKLTLLIPVVSCVVPILSTDLARQVVADAKSWSRTPSHCGYTSRCTFQFVKDTPRIT